jgi:hypothetical protein
MESEVRSRRDVTSPVGMASAASGGAGRAEAQTFARHGRGEASPRGLLDRRSRSRSYQLRATTHRPLVCGTPAAAAARLGGLLEAARRRG